jgi:hypothetical protein
MFGLNPESCEYRVSTELFVHAWCGSRSAPCESELKASGKFLVSGLPDSSNVSRFSGPSLIMSKKNSYMVVCFIDT